MIPKHQADYMVRYMREPFEIKDERFPSGWYAWAFDMDRGQVVTNPTFAMSGPHASKAEAVQALLDLEPRPQAR